MRNMHRYFGTAICSVPGIFFLSAVLLFSQDSAGQQSKLPGKKTRSSAPATVEERKPEASEPSASFPQLVGLRLPQ